MKVLVCDDIAAQSRQTQRAIGSRAEVTVLAGEDLTRALTALFEGVASALDQGTCPKGQLAGGRFDGFDLAVVDNNLTKLELGGARLSAEGIIGYLRAFTDVPYFVSLNKNPHVDFDLRYLFGDSHSQADLALNTKHLSNDRLWGRQTEGGFLPWYWPRLEDAVARRRRQVEFLEEGGALARPVWGALGFPEEAEHYVSFRARAALSSDADIRDVTFGELCNTSGVLTPAENNALKGLAEKGDEFALSAVRRIAAYRADRWLRRDILGAQDVLVDLPHLLTQMPCLVGEGVRDLDRWNAVVQQEESPFELDRALFKPYLENAQFQASMWAPVPCFWWPTLRADRALEEIVFNIDEDWPDAVFCEDVSRFVPVSPPEGQRVPQEFESEVEGSWPRRFVLDVDGYRYSPRSRIVGSVEYP